MVSLEFANYGRCYQYKVGISGLNKTLPGAIRLAWQCTVNLNRHELFSFTPDLFIDGGRITTD